MGICPETKRRSPTLVTGVYGPIAFGIPSGKILSTFYIRYTLYKMTQYDMHTINITVVITLFKIDSRTSFCFYITEIKL